MSKKKEQQTQLNRREKAVSIMLVIIIMLTFVLILGGIYFRGKENRSTSGSGSRKSYQSHYMFIAEHPSNEFWKAVYKGAKDRGEKEQVYVENLAAGTDESFDVEEMVEIAAAASVDGIILEADGSKDLDALIDRASEENIPVITVYEDAPQSKRKSFVGINEHQLGEIYGSQIMELKEPGKTLQVTVLTNRSEEDAEPDLIYSGMKGAVAGEAIELEVLRVDGQDSFSAEETIRNLVIDHQKMPDVLVCLDEAATIAAVQSVVDYNAVGAMQIIGFYSTDEVLDGIEKGIISSSVTVDAGQIGEKAVDALLEYRKKVHISEYETVSPQVITKETISQYKKDGE